MPSWLDAYNVMQTTMAKSNGLVAGTRVPRLTNEQAASVLRYAVKLVELHKLDAALVSQWYPLALALAGWKAPGDRFLVDETHRKTKLADGATAPLWQTALNVASTLQTRGVPFSQPTVNPAADYDLVLRKAWTKMQADAGRDDAATPRPNLPPSPSPAAAPAASPDDADSPGIGGGLATLLLLYLISEGI